MLGVHNCLHADSHKRHGFCYRKKPLHLWEQVKQALGQKGEYRILNIC